MGFYSALGVGVTGITSQSQRIGTISNNIANLNTVGYKGSVVGFRDLLASDAVSTYSPAGARASVQARNSLQGEITPTHSTTDIAVKGAGFIPVSEASPAGGAILFTRAGSFRPDANGDFTNTAGFFLQGWQLDSNGDLPAAIDVADNVNLASATAIANLVTVNIADLFADPVATSNVSIQANLTASQVAYAGPPAYDATLNTANMASGSVQAHYGLPIGVLDSTGEEHSLMVNFLKTGINSWAVEIVANPAADVTATDGQVAFGTVTFNGDGTLAGVSGAIASPVAVAWTNGAAASSITFDWGTAGPIFGTPNATIVGLTDGLHQFDDSYHLVSFFQDGFAGGGTNLVQIDENGYVVASFNDGSVRRLYKIPLVNFIEPDRLEALSGNVFAQTESSGDANFRQVGQTGVGVLNPGALEASNVDLGRQLADMIVAQRAYQANSKTISSSDDMLRQLDEMLRG